MKPGLLTSIIAVWGSARLPCTVKLIAVLVHTPALSQGIMTLNWLITSIVTTLWYVFAI